MDRIVVATDFSARSERAMRRAMLIARSTGAALTLLHVVDADRPDALVASDLAVARPALERMAQAIAADNDVDTEARVVVGDVDTGILEAAVAAGAQIIVVGPHRRRMRDVFIGTTVERLLRRASLPLLVAAQAACEPYAETLLALDFDDASRAAGRAAVALGLFEHTVVTVMHAFEAPAERMARGLARDPALVDHYVAAEHAEAVAKLHALAREIGLPEHRQRVAPVNGVPARSILETARHEGSDLVVMGTNQRRGLERLLIGSVTEDVIRDAQLDVLIVPIDPA